MIGRHRHLLGTEELSQGELLQILDLAVSMKEVLRRPLKKVPSLRGIGARAPFMHDGCAKTLTDRFTVCGNSTSHGLTQTLGPTEIADLVAYLETL